jgi:signal transduction histidine kinase/CheY-like chemotaxis protein
MIASAYRKGGLHRFDWTCVNSEGGKFIVEVCLMPVTIKGQVMLYTTWRDITERKRSEETRRSLERQMQHAQKLESLGVLAGGIAHDFNNLLMAILGNADLALNQLEPHSPARGNIEEIETVTRRAADLARQMLAYSGKGRFVIEPINLNGFVKEMAHLLTVSISKKVVLKYNFADNLPVCEGDATQIRQIIMNLIVNASEAIGEKSGVIALSTGAMDCDSVYLQDLRIEKALPAGLYVYIEVSDTGCGMDRETLNKIFDPFFTTKFTGRGLGLSAVLGIVRGHKGTIKVYSEAGKGTTFKILFPASEVPGVAAMKQQAETAREPWRGEGTVLIADDEETICAVGKRMLECIGFRVLTAPDGREAVEVYREHAEEIVCVLLDLTMPHLNGAEAFREIRLINPQVKVILCSGYNMLDATQRFVGEGLAGFIQKPYNMAELREKMQQALPAAGRATGAGRRHTC